MQSSSISVIGAGSWGSALAIHLARQQRPVVLWGRNADKLASYERSGANTDYLPETRFPDTLSLDADLEQAVSGCELVLLATPSQAFRDMLGRIAKCLPEGVGVAWACKGFEGGSGRLLHDVAEEVLGPQVPTAALAGPSFAREVARDLPTAVTVASTFTDFGEQFAAALHGGALRAYTTDDMTGAELGGAVKNVMAIATGIADGMKLGDNARAALITRGLAEIMRLSAQMGARPETLTGLAGVGDLVLTCTGDLSRNRRFGLLLGAGRGVEEALTEIGQVVEGVAAAAEVCRLARQLDVEMPISDQVHRVINGEITPALGLRTLLSREQRSERD